MYYKVVEVEEGMYINDEGKQFEIFEGQTVKVPEGTTIEQCGWIEANNIDVVLEANQLRENVELLNKIRRAE